ncbi:MAG: PAS domain-containing protein [bacterium]|nr:PAS domain-containing protein [bacterium]
MADWVWEVDENGIFTYCSDRSIEMMGFTPAELIGKSPFEFMPPEEATRVSAVFSNLASKRAPIVNLENWVLSKNGALMCMVTNAVPFLDDLEISRDIVVSTKISRNGR